MIALMGSVQLRRGRVRTKCCPSDARRRFGAKVIQMLELTQVNFGFDGPFSLELRIFIEDALKYRIIWKII